MVPWAFHPSFVENLNLSEFKELNVGFLKVQIDKFKYDNLSIKDVELFLPFSLKEKIRLNDTDHYSILENMDALLLITEWKLYRNVNYKILSEKMKQKFIFDGRNQFDPILARKSGFIYKGIGR